MTKQPEALRIADVLIGSPQFTGTPIWQAADMLRTQHALIEELQKALREVPNTQLQYADHIRRQHEAIKVLREALTDALCTLQQVHGYAHMAPADVTRVEQSLEYAERGLQLTEELK